MWWPPSCWVIVLYGLVFPFVDILPTIVVIVAQKTQGAMAGDKISVLKERGLRPTKGVSICFTKSNKLSQLSIRSFA